MELPEFVEQRRPRWSSLERRLARAEEEGLSKLSLDDARQLSRFYRSASADLLWVRSRGESSDVAGYLNDLVGRAYAMTYPGKRLRLADVGSFVSRGFPELLRKELRMFLAAWLFLLAGMGTGYLGMVVDEDAAAYLVPSDHLKRDPTKRAADEAKDDAVSGPQAQAAFSSFLFTHNIGVAITCFALGLTAGVGTALLLFITGVLLGSLAYVYAAKGLAGWFWAWILPHGIPELTAICIAGAAGFVLARGLIAPQGLPRRVSLRREGGAAVRLLLGTITLFVLAGIIEGTISQIHPPHLSVAFKISFAVVVGLGVYAYLHSASWRGDRRTG
ncbi:MAG: stage II sporulation protein M [Myxococcaceae bacterium]